MTELLKNFWINLGNRWKYFDQIFRHNTSLISNPWKTKTTNDVLRKSVFKFMFEQWVWFFVGVNHHVVYDH